MQYVYIMFGNESDVYKRDMLFIYSYRSVLNYIHQVLALQLSIDLYWYIYIKRGHSSCWHNHARAPLSPLVLTAQDCSDMRHGDDPGRKLYGGATGVKCNAEIQEVGLAIQDFQSFSIANGSTYIYI